MTSLCKYSYGGSGLSYIAIQCMFPGAAVIAFNTGGHSLLLLSFKTNVNLNFYSVWVSWDYCKPLRLSVAAQLTSTLSCVKSSVVYR